MGYLSTNGTTADGYCTTSFRPSILASTMLVGASSSDGLDSDSAEFHGFMFFNTGPNIPDTATPTKVKLSYRVTSIQGDYQALNLRPHIGDDIIGSSLERTDYGDVITDGELLGTTTSSAGAKSIESTHADVLDQISLDAYTNIEIDAYWVGPVGSSGVIASIATQENATVAYRPVLEVWWDERIEITKSLAYAIKIAQSITKGLGYAIRALQAITKPLEYKIKAKLTITKTLEYTIKAIKSDDPGVVLGTKNGKPVLIAKGHKAFLGATENKSIIPSDKPNTVISSKPSKSVIINKDNKTPLSVKEATTVICDIAKGNNKSILTSRNSAHVVKSNKESVATIGTKKPKTII